MKQLALALIQLETYKRQRDCLSASLDELSLNYPVIYSQLYREMKRREIESNDPNKINKWLNTSPLNSYVKLHEALILVKSYNIIAKEQYSSNIRDMLCHTIKNGTNMEIAKKICSLIEKSPHLKNIHECLFEYIQQVKLLNVNQGYNFDYNRKNIHAGSIWNNGSDFKQTRINSSEQLNVQWCTQVQPQQQYTSVWPTMLQPNNSKTARGFPHINVECFGYDHLAVTATTDRRPTFDFTPMFSNLTIVSQEMDEVVAKWLQYLKLHKYQWFFNELSYLEIEFIDEDNIEGFINKVNKNAITKGAQKKICISTKTLRGRKQKLQDLLMALDLEVTPNELCEIVIYMRDILNYPIPNRNCVVGDQLQQDIVLVMEKCLKQLLEKLNGIRRLNAHSLLGTSINKYLECVLLITGNQIFMKEQFDKMVIFDKMLKDKVYKMPRNSV